VFVFFSTKIYRTQRPVAPCKERYFEVPYVPSMYLAEFDSNPVVLGSVADPDPGSGTILTPGSGMGKKLGSGSGVINPENISDNVETIFWV
jgi:hypothetical protein